MRLFVVALEEELEHDYLFNWEKKQINNITYYFHPTKDYGLVFSDVGKVNAAYTLTHALTNFKDIELIINIGSCGTVDSNIDVLDLCLVKSTQFLDVDLSMFGYEINQCRKDPKIFLMDKEINKKLDSIIKTNHHLIVGTSDSFIGRENYNNFKDISIVSLVEMELASLAMIAHKFNIPINSIKVVSDSVFNPQPSADEYSTNAIEFRKIISSTIDKIIESYN